MAEEEKEGMPQPDPVVPETREIDGVVYPVRIIPPRVNQHSRIGVSRRSVKWSIGSEMYSYNKKGRSKNSSKT